MTEYVYKSKLSAQITSFIKLKAVMGYKRRSFEPTLYQFDSYLCKFYPDCDFITREIIDGWKVTMVNNSRNTIYIKYSILNTFCRYLNHIGHPCYIPRLPKWCESSFVPYIFTHDEIERLFHYFDNLRMEKHNGNCHFFALPVIFRLLYGAGMRLGEVLSLKNKNVDLDSRTILLEITKNNQHRMIPVNDSLFEVLQQYIRVKGMLRRLRYNEPDDYFFISVLGDDIKSNIIQFYFKKALCACGIPRNVGKLGPRIHDLRHTFAVHSLIQQVKNGVDLYCSLPILSVFLGHSDYRDTETYVRLTIDMFPEIIKKEPRLLDDIISTSNENKPQ